MAGSNAGHFFVPTCRPTPAKSGHNSRTQRMWAELGGLPGVPSAPVVGVLGWKAPRFRFSANLPITYLRAIRYWGGETRRAVKAMSIHTETEELPRESQRGCSQRAGVEPIVLDCDHVLNHAGGDPELLIQLCYNFLHELPLRVEQLQHAIVARDYHRAGRALLQLQSCILVFGVGHASCTAEKLELALREHRYRRAKSEWDRLQLQLRDLVPQVQRLILEMVTPRTPVQ